MKVNFKISKDQRELPTPKSTSNFIDIFCGVSGIICTWIITAKYVPANVSDVVVSILSVSGSILQFLKPYFAVKTSRKSIPVEQVDTIQD